MNPKGAWGSTCDLCQQIIKDGQSSYHIKGHCLKYSYDEHLNFTKVGVFPDQYQPTVLSVKKDFIYAAISALEAGLEYAQECLIRHDQNLGRTISRNKREAEYMEEDIRKIKAAIENLKK